MIFLKRYKLYILVITKNTCREFHADINQLCLDIKITSCIKNVHHNMRIIRFNKLYRHRADFKFSNNNYAYHINDTFRIIPPINQNPHEHEWPTIAYITVDCQYGQYNRYARFINKQGNACISSERKFPFVDEPYRKLAESIINKPSITFDYERHIN